MRKRAFRRFGRGRVLAASVSLLLWLAWLWFAPQGGSPENVRLDDSSAAQSEDISQRESLRVCSWNVRNYNVSNRRAGDRWASRPKPESEREAVGATLAKINADVVLLQEMGDMTYLEDLRARLKKRGAVYRFAAVGGYDAPSRLAILSKFAPAEVFDFSSLPIEVKGSRAYSPRGTLGIKLACRAAPLFVFCLHLKSKVGAKKADENFIPFRFAELRAISAKVSPLARGGGMVLIAGDFNDEPSKALLRNLRGFSAVPQGDFAGAAYTYYWAKKNVFYVYDFFAASNAVLPRVSRASVVPSGAASDHRPIYLDISLK